MFTVADLVSLSIRYFLLAGAQICQLLENDLMATLQEDKRIQFGFY